MFFSDLKVIMDSDSSNESIKEFKNQGESVNVSDEMGMEEVK